MIANEPTVKPEVSLRDIIYKLHEWYRYLSANWKVIILVTIIGGILGFIYANYKKPVYTAECTFVLEDASSSSSLGQYAGIASMVGIDGLGSANSGIFQGENIIGLYKSRSMIEKTLLSYFTVNGKRELLIDRYIYALGLREKWADNSQLSRISFDISRSHFTIQHDSIISVFVDDINENYMSITKPDKKLNLISVTIKAKDELFAKNFTTQIVSNVNDFYIQTRTKKSLENYNVLQRQADSIRRELNSAIKGVAYLSEVNPNINAALNSLRVPSQQRQIDVQANSTIYSELVKNLELAKVSLRHDTPLIQVIDEPILPLEVAKVGKIKQSLLGGFIFSFIAIFSLVIKKLFRDF